MSGGGYQRATRKRAATIDHNDGDKTIGYVLAPVGLTLPEMLSQGAAFLPVETQGGAITYISMASVKRVTPLDEHAAEADEAAARAEQERRAAQQQERAVAEARARAQREQQERAQQERNRERERERRRAAAQETAQRARASSAQAADTSSAGAFSNEMITRRPEILKYLAMLGAPRAAEWGEIQQAYRRMAKEHHPDRLRGMGAAEGEIEAAAVRLLDINDAYRALSSFYPAAA